MKCLHVITNLGLGGGQNVMLSIIEALAARVDFTVFAVQGVRDGEVGARMFDRLAALGVKVVCGTRLPIKYGGMIAGGVALAAHLRRHRYDVIHAHTEIPEAVLAVALTLSPGPAGTPLVRTIHNTVLWPAWARIGRWVERRLSGAAAAAVSSGASTALHRFRAEHGLAALPKDRVRVILNGVRAHAATTPFSSSSGPTRLLFAGRLERQKGADLLPAILGEASRRHHGPVTIDIIGQGSFEPALTAALRTLGHGWTGTLHRPDPALAATLGGYDAVLMPSRFEGLPLLCVEALVAGTPVLLTDAEGFDDVADAAYPLRAQAGDTPAFADLLVRFLADPGRYRQAIAVLRPALTLRFAVDRMAEAYAALYEEVAAAA